MKTQLVTEQGFAALKQELDHLWRVYRPEITAKVTWAASLGDRSENADYKENKRILRQIDSRVRYLSKCIENLKVVAYSPEQEGKVCEACEGTTVYVSEDVELMSTEWDTSIDVTFDNNSNLALDYYWQDYSGGAVHY